ncbi:MAG: hypothetical protein L3J50_12445 [Emcibacter sp.]|nr:hypothetical protein [Emcibacter sp.]
MAFKNEEKFCYEIVASFHKEAEAHHWLERQEREFLLGELSFILEQWDYHDDPSIKEKVLRAYKLLASALEQKKGRQSFKKAFEIHLDSIIVKNPNKENANGK